MNTLDMTPTEVAEFLSKNPPADGEGMAVSSDQQASLGFSNGYFVLSWSASNIDSYDWVGLYSSINAQDSDFVGGAWQWATKGGSFVTGQGMIAGYQARYLVWDKTAGKYVSVARTDPFPVIRVCSK